MLEFIKNPAIAREGEALPENDETLSTPVVDEQLCAAYNKRLDIIHNACTAAEIGKHTARDAKYISYINLFIWWREVQGHPGMWRFFERRVDTGRRPSARVKAGVNFSSLVRLGFANFLAVDSNFCSRANTLLNAIHDEINRAPEKYQHDTVPKLLLFLNAKHWGMKSSNKSNPSDATADTNQGKPASTTDQTAEHSDSSDKKKTTKTKKGFGFTQKNRIEHLLHHAKAFFLTANEGNRIHLNEPLLPEVQPDLTNSDQTRKQQPLAVVLVSQNSNGQFVVHADPIDEAREDHAALIRTSLVNSYRSSFLPIAKSIRTIAECVRSQMLLPNMAKIESKLETDTDVPSRWHKGFMKAKQRLIYIKESKQFLLSPVATKLGVVSLATPKDPVMEEPASDLMLLKRSISRLERAMRSNDLAMYTVADQEKIPCLGKGESSRNGIWLTSRTNADHRILLDFQTIQAWIDYNPAQVNADWKLLALGKKWKLTPYVMKQLNMSAVEQWLSSYGDNITRDRNAFVKLVLNDHQITIHFDKVGLTYQRNVSFNFSAQQNIGLKFSAEFRAKWLMAAIDGISSVTHIADIDLYCNDYGILFQYETSAACFKVAVPTYGFSVASSNPCFLSYTPEELQPDTPIEHTLADDAEVYADAEHQQTNQ